MRSTRSSRRGAEPSSTNSASNSRGVGGNVRRLGTPQGASRAEFWLAGRRIPTETRGEHRRRRCRTSETHVESRPTGDKHGQQWLALERRHSQGRKPSSLDVECRTCRNGSPRKVRGGLRRSRGPSLRTCHQSRAQRWVARAQDTSVDDTVAQSDVSRRVWVALRGTSPRMCLERARHTASDAGDECTRQ